MSKNFTHHAINFAVENNICFPRNLKIMRTMELLIILILLPFWLFGALKNGANNK